MFVCIGIVLNVLCLSKEGGFDIEPMQRYAISCNFVTVCPSITHQYCVETVEWIVFTARRLAMRGICRRRVSVCLSVCVCMCVCLSHSGIVSKRLNVGSRK